MKTTVEISCDTCKKVFTKRPDRVRTNNFCNKECWNAFHRNAKQFICEMCKKTVTRTPGKIVGKIYCSVDCSRKAITPALVAGAIRKQNRITEFCLTCKSAVTRRQSVVGKRVFCGNECKAVFEAKQSSKQSHHPLYQTWKGMKARCYNPKNTKYPDYGGRGISVCEVWRKSFQKFLADMGEKPDDKNSIDRINNYGNYEPGNCRWATAKEQSNNQRKKRTNAKRN